MNRGIMIIGANAGISMDMTRQRGLIKEPKDLLGLQK